MVLSVVEQKINAAQLRYKRPSKRSICGVEAEARQLIYFKRPPLQSICWTLHGYRRSFRVVSQYWGTKLRYRHIQRHIHGRPWSHHGFDVCKQCVSLVELSDGKQAIISYNTIDGSRAVWRNLEPQTAANASEYYVEHIVTNMFRGKINDLEFIGTGSLQKPTHQSLHKSQHQPQISLCTSAISINTETYLSNHHLFQKIRILLQN